MISNALAAALARRGIHYGWVVAATTFLTMLVTAGAMGGPADILRKIQEGLGKGGDPFAHLPSLPARLADMVAARGHANPSRPRSVA